jgi:hypothetical protein
LVSYAKVKASFGFMSTSGHGVSVALDVPH